MINLQMVGVLLLAYLIGTIPTAYLLAKFTSGEDIRTKGSGNSGTTNAMRVYGKKVGLTVFFVDFFKGFLGVFLAMKLYKPEVGIFAAIAVILGHVYPVYLGFKGGKGVACLFGTFLALDFWMAFYGGIVFGLVLLITRTVSISSMVSGLSMIPMAYLFHHDDYFIYGTIFIALFLIYTHRSNIKRLIEGKESKIGSGRSQ